MKNDVLVNTLRSIKLCENYNAGDEIRSIDAEVDALNPDDEKSYSQICKEIDEEYKPIK